MEKKKPENVFLEVIINGAVIAKKEMKTSEKIFLSIMLGAKKK